MPLMRRAGGGAIVLISSINGERGKFGQANYAASKAGLIALARTAARELGRFGIRVNCRRAGLDRHADDGGGPRGVPRSARSTRRRSAAWVSPTTWRARCCSCAAT